MEALCLRMGLESEAGPPFHEWERTGKGVLDSHVQMKTCPERAEKSERLPLWIIL